MAKEKDAMQGWERQMDGTMRAVRHFDMDREIMNFQKEREMKKLEKKRELQLQKRREMEKKKSIEKTLTEREISK